MQAQFRTGLKDGIPICLGYLSVSFGFGILAVSLGLPVLAAVGISLTNLTSAGQVAGVGIIAAGGGLLEMILAQLVINIRYSLMGISLSQKLSDNFRTPQRLLTAFGITDEIFVMAASKPGKLQPAYMYGLILISLVGWVAGTFLGAAAGNLLPAEFASAMGIVLYGMFLAIFIPAARDNSGVLLAVCIAILFSVLFRYLLPGVSGGFSLIICAVLAAVLAALLRPVPQESEGEDL